LRSARRGALTGQSPPYRDANGVDLLAEIGPGVTPDQLAVGLCPPSGLVKRRASPH